MKNVRRVTIMLIGLLWVYSAAKLEFVPHIVHIQKGNWGKTGIGDFDNDGKMDFTGGIRSNAVYWFRNPGTFTEKWERFDIDPQNGGCVGGEPAFVDGDSLIDFISHGMWYRNSPENPGKSFEKIDFAGGTINCHDVVAVDLDKDGLVDAMNHDITWWKNPGPDKVTEQWQSHSVAKVKYHGGIAPHGWGDIDGDGDNDVVGIGKWWKNLDGKGTSWEEKTYSTWSKRNQNRIWVADLDGDGDQDIAAGEGDSGGGRGAWMKNVDGKGEEWETIPLDMGGIAGDFHSVGAHDYDNDGDIDICLPKNGGGESNEWLIFENMDGKATFERREVYKGHGGHETVWGDLDGDGDIDMVSKCWCGTATFVILENKLDPPAPVSVEPSIKNPFAFNALVSQTGLKPVLEVVSNASGPFSIELLNTQGARLAFQSGEGQQVRSIIPLKAFENGIYLVRLNAVQGSATQMITLSR